MSDFPPIIEILSNHYKYWSQSIGYTDIQLNGLPDSVDVNGEKLERKDEFHITTINVQKIAELIDPQDTSAVRTEIVREFKEFIKTNKLDKFKISNNFRFVRRGEHEKTIIVLADIPGASEFFEKLRQKYKKPVPLQPFHITLIYC